MRDERGSSEDGLVLEVLLCTMLVIGSGVTAAAVTDAPVGSVADWIAATATAAAFVAAVIASYYAARAFEAERRRDARHDDELRRQQASAVGAWTNLTAMKRRDGTRVVFDSVAGDLNLLNASLLPVFRLMVEVWAHPPRSEVDAEDPPMGKLLMTYDQGTLQPGPEPTVVAIELPELAATMNTLREAGLDDRLLVTTNFEFFDAAGIHWRHGSDGVLRVIESSVFDF